MKNLARAAPRKLCRALTAASLGLVRLRDVASPLIVTWLLSSPGEAFRCRSPGAHSRLCIIVERERKKKLLISIEMPGSHETPPPRHPLPSRDSASDSEPKFFPYCLLVALPALTLSACHCLAARD